MAAQTVWIEKKISVREENSIEAVEKKLARLPLRDLRTGIEYRCGCREPGGRCSKKCIYNLV